MYESEFWRKRNTFLFWQTRTFSSLATGAIFTLGGILLSRYSGTPLRTSVSFWVGLVMLVYGIELFRRIYMWQYHHDTTVRYWLKAVKGFFASAE